MSDIKKVVLGYKAAERAYKAAIIHYELACKEIVREFSKRQGIEFDGWVGDDVGGIAGFISQYYFNVGDMVLDLSRGIKRGVILEWQDAVVENTLSGGVSDIDYISYLRDLGYKV